jgi:hypothetical protein
MRRYETPTHNIELPFDTNIIAKARLVYSQNDVQILVKELSDCQCKGNTLSVRLTQEETALFDCKKMFVEVQLHILTTGNDSIVSDIEKVPVDKCLDNEVL